MRKVLLFALCVAPSLAFAADGPTDYMARAVLRCTVGQEQYIEKITELQNQIDALKAEAAKAHPEDKK